MNPVFFKAYFLFQSVGKCTPKWIRYSAKNKNRIRCVHPDCETKKDINFTYAGIMKHIIELHTSQETAVSSIVPCWTVGQRLAIHLTLT